ncbi:hypothetical protein [Pseudomonas sp. GL-R-19]|uniref:hypothetical protein n=1 Tax=Pseudomonas sp. GL-R-19 TaxID=2832391 RepID=UPI001CBBB6D8|nr:hypothetical protein [Pseudomonas sp. GL-R-19]
MGTETTSSPITGCAQGDNAYHVIERATGKVKGFRFTWKAAINLAQVLEARADGMKVNIDGWDK